jgi:valyl-tRNA synthetase
MDAQPPKEYEPSKVEPKWQRWWEERGIYRFDPSREGPTYVIDTPPPYPSGEFHLGTALNWTYMDIVARYKRMRGYNVLFPQGWDCHGLPTEVQVERKYGIRKGDLPPARFRELCVRLTQENIEKMRKEMRSLGFSIDWTREYRTMDPSYYSRTQLSFVRLYRQGRIYRGEHPVNWCPRCETAIADAEVEYEEREGKLNYLRFKVEGGGELLIATTRPEYLPACVAVAVHPEDERYREYVGRRVEVPACGRKVEVIQDPEVDPRFGTGVVMICTYGDKTDVRWVARHGLPVIRLLDEKGRMTEEAGRYAGLTVEEARRAILEDLRREGSLVREEGLVQSVGVCWRCKTPVEILTKKQWFMRVLDLAERVVEEARKVRWVPEYMGQRLVDWVRSMDWDWVISRQRIFATPIPVWYCRKCGEVVVAEEDQLPVDPQRDRPRGRCPRCGGEEFEGERDVLDTWMDSSITIAVHAGWPQLDRRLFPADLQPNGTDIIRTWDYYLLVRHLALLGEAPYRTVLINGMVFGEDGRKMSKSLGNFIETSSVYGKYGADALRQWSVLAASTGSDVPFSWKEVVFGYRFLQKLWNAVRFAGPHLRGGAVSPEGLRLRAVDRWILSRLQRVVERVTSLLEDFQFNQALITLQSFVWHELCDLYIEEVKHRLYGGRREEVRYVLREVISKVCRLLAPFIPHLTEEIYQTYLREEEGYPSVHLAPWPEPEGGRLDEEAEKTAGLLHELLGAIRQFKSSRGIPLSGELGELRVFAPPPLLERLREVEEDLVATAHLRGLHLSSERPELEERVVAVEPDLSRLGPRLRSGVRRLLEYLREHGAEVARELERGPVTLELEGERVELRPGDLKVKKEVSYRGEGVEVLGLPERGILLLLKPS